MKKVTRFLLLLLLSCLTSCTVSRNHPHCPFGRLVVDIVTGGILPHPQPDDPEPYAGARLLSEYPQPLPAAMAR